MKAYYARPMSLYKTFQEKRDIQLINALGYEVIEINKSSIQEGVKKQGMEIFKDLVKPADTLFFRAFIDGSIGAGVAKEIQWAKESDIPVLELPSQISRRTLSVDNTRNMLEELGQR